MKQLHLFCEIIYTCKASIVEAEEDQSNLLKNIIEFNNKSRPRTIEGKANKRYLRKSICSL